MAIKTKKAGAYVDPVGIFAKKSGVYAAITGLSVKSGGAYTLASGPPTLPYDPVLIINGDSQAHGTADNQATYVSAYVADPLVKILNGAGAFVTYTPGTAGGSGLAFGANGTGVGPEIGFIRKFRAAYPNNTLYIVKEGNSGAFQTRGGATGTVTASVTGNIITPTVGTFANGDGIGGTGVPDGIYLPFAQSGNAFYTWDVGGTSYTKGDITSRSMTRYPAYASWSPTFGLCFNGNSAAINNGSRARFVSAMAALVSAGKTPKVIADVLVLGTNDASIASLTGFDTETAAFVAQKRTAFGSYMTGVPTVMARIRNSGASAAAVRAAQLSVKNADSRMFLLDMDAQPVSADSIHWRIAALDYMGAGAFDCAFGLSAGI